MQPGDHAWARQADIQSVLISQQRIAERVAELAREILHDHQPQGDSPDVEITLIPILTGAMIFCADLMRALSVKLRIGLLTVTSYPGASLRSQGSSLLSQQLGDLRGRHIILIDDILDSGGTLKLVVPILKSLHPANVKTCVLLSKDRPSAKEVQVDYVGFQIPDEFVVGYGLDYDNYYRNLPDIVTLKPSVLAATHDRPA
jgi:hypoxanthine phosphoribosyltransferase